MSANSSECRPDHLPLSSGKLQVAFLGGAYQSAVGGVHRVAIEMDERFDLVAGCFSRHPEANRLSARQYGVAPERTYGSLDELLHREANRLHAIVILTPTDQHKAHVLRCLAAGVPVICEKALATASEGAAEIRTLLSQQKGFLAVTYNYTGYPMVRELKHMIEQGRLGKIQQIHMEMPQEGFARVGQDGAPVVPQEWRLRDGKISTISLDLGVHLHLMARFLTNERPCAVAATSDRYGNFPQIVDNISCIARYTNQLNCSIWYSKTALGQRNGLKLRLFGETGAAEWLQENPEYLLLADNRGRKTVLDRASSEVQICQQARYTRFKAGHPAGFIEAFANYYADVADALTAYLATGQNSSNPYVFGIDDSLEGLQLLEAIAEAAVHQRWVAIQ